MISTHCRLVKFLMSCLALKAGDHSHNFELWCLVLSVELVWYIQRSKPQPVLPVYHNNISILLHKQQYQLSEFSFPCTCQLWSLFERSTQGWLYGLRKATLLTVDLMMAASWSSSVTMVNKNILSWSYVQSTIPPYGSAFRTNRLEVEIWHGCLFLYINSEDCGLDILEIIRKFWYSFHFIILWLYMKQKGSSQLSNRSNSYNKLM